MKKEGLILSFDVLCSCGVSTVRHTGQIRRYGNKIGQTDSREQRYAPRKTLSYEIIQKK